MRISDWSSDVCSSDLRRVGVERRRHGRSQQRGNCQESEKGLTHFQTSLEKQDHRSSLTACRSNLRPCPEIELTNFVMPDLIRHPALRARMAGPRIDSGMTKAKAEYCQASSKDFRAACSAASEAA